jgi:dihydropteroate synthase
MTKPRLQWSIRDRQLVIGERTLMMGVLNVTPDSFSDGGKYSDPDRAFARAIELEEQGADIIDIGAESTRPGSARISEGEELRRLVPVLKRLKDQLSIPICVDTYKAAVAEKAIEHGAHIINDPSGLTWDPGIAKVVAQHDAGLVINHMRGTPETWAKLGPVKDLMITIKNELEAAVNRARHAGVDKSRIVIDPGIGFGKRKEQNAEIIAQLRELQPLLLPVLVGPSRKSFLAQSGASETEFATAAAVTASILAGAGIVRVHDVVSMKAVIQVSDQIFDALPEPRVEEERPARKPRREEIPAPPPFREERQDRPTRREFRPRPDDDRQDRPPRREFRPGQGEGPARPPRRDFRPGQGDRKEGPPRREFRPGQGDRKEGPPRREFRPGQGDRKEGPPRREFRPGQGDRKEGPPRREFRPGQGDRKEGPPRREFRPPAGKPSGGRPPFKSSGPPRKRSGPPTKRSGPPRKPRP